MVVTFVIEIHPYSSSLIHNHIGCWYTYPLISSTCYTRIYFNNYLSVGSFLYNRIHIDGKYHKNLLLSLKVSTFYYYTLCACTYVYNVFYWLWLHSSSSRSSRGTSNDICAYFSILFINTIYTNEEHK